jgi:hypothetical protein
MSPSKEEGVVDKNDEPAKKKVKVFDDGIDDDDVAKPKQLSSYPITEWKSELDMHYTGTGTQTVELVLVEGSRSGTDDATASSDDENGNVITRDVLVEKCMKYIRPESEAVDFQCIGNEDDIDFKGAEKALRKDGRIDDIKEYIGGGGGDKPLYGGIGNQWNVATQFKVTLSKEEAIEKIIDLFNGHLCMFQDGYNNYGQNPLTPYGSSQQGKIN